MTPRLANLPRVLALATAALLLAACGGRDNALDPAGVQAGRISHQWWLFFSIVTFVYVAVMIALIIALLKHRGLSATADATKNDAPDLQPDEARESRMRYTIAGLVAVTTMILFIFLLSDWFTGRALSAYPLNPMRIQLTGRQWWWEARYTVFPWERGGGQPSGYITTANELHIPVGTPVLLELASRDVIHSFWIPQLHGKKDLIPGEQATTWLQADKPGTYVGRCAEYCGEQHANMQIWVVAESQDDFNKWLAKMRQSAADPQEQRLQKGRAVFLNYSCVMCHTVQGTPANGRVGPDLTHVASRQRIAAGTLEWNRQNVRDWILNPQAIKPGTRMPRNTLRAEDLDPLLDWLETLK
jgi:cytochrome c oxidase subunit 2